MSRLQLLTIALAACGSHQAMRARAALLQITHYEADDSGVTVHFDQDQPPVRAKILIGADGYFSKPRRQCLDDGPPAFAVSTCHSNLPLLSLVVLTWDGMTWVDSTGDRTTQVHTARDLPFMLGHEVD